MAIPILLAPAALGAFLAAVIAKVVVSELLIKIAIAVASVVAFIAVYAIFFTTINGALSSLDYLSIPPFLQTAFTTLPSNVDVCLSLIVSTKIAELIYRFQMTIISLRKI